MFCFLAILISFITSIGPIAFNDRPSLIDKACEQALNNSIMTNRTVKQLIKEYGLNVLYCSAAKDFDGIEDCPNSIIVVKTNIDLQGKTITIPENSILFFKGGRFSNGCIIGNKTRIISSNREIFSPGASAYRGYEINGTYGYVAKHRKSITLTGSWSNKLVGFKWTGIQSEDSIHCQSLAINNFITLHSLEADVIFKKGRYFVYDKVRSSGHGINFSSSELVSIDFLRVEDDIIPLPKGVIPVNLKSVYGLLDINDEKARISNVIINGRASSRNENPILGSECLVSITRCREGSIDNIKLVDAVDCAICTSDIENVSFNNLCIDGCGEHGFYTHAFRGSLSFNDCKFVNCGNSRDLYNTYGCAACVKAAGLRNHTPEELLDFKVFFNSCTFYAFHSVPVVTTYGDFPYAEYKNCNWEGVGGYVTMNEKFVEVTGRPYEYLFYNCANPCGAYNSSNVIRKLYGCSSVRNPFDDTEIVENCIVQSCYNEARNRYSNQLINLVKKPLIIRNTSFIKGNEDVSIRNIVYNCRPIMFDNCKWSFQHAKTNIHRGLYCIELRKEDGTVSGTDYITFSNCSFSIDQYRLLLSVNTHLKFNEGKIMESYGSFLNEFDKSNDMSITNFLEAKTR